MIILPSGRIAGITNERARYHATRRGIKVKKDAPLYQLYKLVDVICYNAKHSDANNKCRFTFSGLTLSDLLQSTSCSETGWDAKDKDYFFHWINQDVQINKILGAKRMVIYDDLPSKIHVHDYPQRLFSPLSDYIKSINMDNAPALQWLKTLCNLPNKGIRSDELHWCGIKEYLTAQTNNRKVSKKEILAQMDYSSLRIELSNELMPSADSVLAFKEVAQVISFTKLAKSGIKAEHFHIPVIRFVNELLNYKVGILKNKSMGNPPRPAWFALDSYGNALCREDKHMFFDNAIQAFESVNLHARRTYGFRGRLNYSNKYQYVTLCEGQDYREWLVTLPDYSQSHFTSHYTERNVLVHIRTKTRIDSDKRKLLFIEEIQSDWHRAVSSKVNSNRWNRKIPDAPFRKEWVGLAAKLMLLYALEDGFDGIAWADGQIQESHYHRQMPGIRRIYDKILPESLERLGKAWGATVTSTSIPTRKPWLRAERLKDKWRVTDVNGVFRTQPQVNKCAAMSIIERHSKKTYLTVPLFEIPSGMRERISQQGLPLFGFQLR